MGLLVNTMKNETEIREEIEALRSLTTLQLKGKYREVFGEQSKIQSQAVSIPPHRLAHPGERVGRPVRTRSSTSAGDR
jgi:hypothetical protein